MVASKRLYDILGVAPDADENAIKRAYKKAALKWHPDRNTENKEKAEEKFKEVAEAYDVLSNKEKRRVYDQVGESYKDMGNGGGGGGGGRGGMPGGFTSSSFQGDPNEIFKQFFGAQFNPASSSFDDDDPFASMFGGMGGRGGGGMQFMSGGMPGMGMGGMPGMGGGMPFGGGMQAKRKGPPKEFPLECTLEDLYTGCVKKRKLTRKRVRNGKPVDDSKVVEITVQPGWKNGTKVTFPGESDEVPGQTPGDIIFVLKEAKHPTFTRDGADLVYQPSLPAQSGPVTVPVLNGGSVTIRIASGTASTSIPEKGMPVRKGGKQVGHGDIVVKPKWGK
eukprot:TRINITY_DN976_c0_g1_i1.p1 TRINITY_DN976_c0_g1~~TRINITY_DN976_c0_g1_i1.p1  ORF type:complete len:334 (+),score=57.58 TRINITY_DN976_c0_g1_i1:78-1079(+)